MCELFRLPLSLSSIAHFFLLINNNLLYEYVTFCLSIHLLKDNWIAVCSVKNKAFKNHMQGFVCVCVFV